VRPIIYRLAMSEIYVPYGIPDPNWAWRTAFDIGEYNLGQFAVAQEKNADVPENAVFFDSVLAATRAPQAAPTPYRTRWRCTSATDPRSGSAPIRRRSSATRGLRANWS
jgi:hypothetical protein